MALKRVKPAMPQIIINMYRETSCAGIFASTTSCSCTPGLRSIYWKKNGIASNITDTMADPVSISERCDAEAQVAFQFCFNDMVLLRFKCLN